jgi:hypothetical protein
MRYLRSLTCALVVLVPAAVFAQQISNTFFQQAHHVVELFLLSLRKLLRSVFGPLRPIVVVRLTVVHDRPPPRRQQWVGFAQLLSLPRLRNFATPN